MTCRYLFVVLLAGLLAGCAGGSAPSAGSSSTSPSATPSATGTTASVGQYAGIIAGYREDVARDAETLKGCVIDSADTTCEITLLTVSVMSEGLSTELEGASVDGPNNGLYIGAPPAEIARLLEKTQSASLDVKTMADAYLICKSACRDEFAQAYFSVTRLETKFDAWEPYL